MVKKILKSIIRVFGYDLKKYRPSTLGVDPIFDMQQIVGAGCEHITIFDVGANIGQSIHLFKKRFLMAEIHSFEPSKVAYEKLCNILKKEENVTIKNMALGALQGEQTLFVNSHGELSSFLKPGNKCGGEIITQETVAMDTLDHYCQESGLRKIDILKIDTQGYELEVLNGGYQMLCRGNIHLIYLEVTFTEMYERLPSFVSLYQFLEQCGYKLVSFYKFHYDNDITGWSDALFVNPRYGRLR